jgi:Tol biopolymer transport system component
MNATAGGLLTTLNPALASNQNVFGYQISPDGARVVYNITTMTSTLGVQHGNLYSVLIGGGASTLLTTAAAPGFGVFGGNFFITSDSQRVVYRYQKNGTTGPVLESASLSGSNRATLYSQGSGDPVYHLNVSPDGQWVVYNTYPSYQMHSVPTAGGAAVGLGRGFDPRTTPDSSRVMYTTDQLSGNYDLYTQQIFSGGTRNLSRVGDGAQVGRYAISPDGQSIVFEVDYLGADSPVELRVSDGGEAPLVFYAYLPLVKK